MPSSRNNLKTNKKRKVSQSRFKHFFLKVGRNRFIMPIFVLVFAGLGVYLLRSSFAAAPSIVCPLSGRPAITSGYRTVSRPNHAGIDIGVKTGTPIYAPQDGTMGNKRVDSNGYGLYVDLANSSYRYRFAHLQSVVVASGAVKAGQLIAYSDSGGDATGPHLHFEIRTNPSQISYGLTNTINPATSYNNCSSSAGGGQAPSSGGSAAGCSNHPTIRQSATGGADCVKHLQSHLNGFGYHLAIDGAWGSGTNNAVRDFQSKHGLGVDGVVGPNTWNALHGSGSSGGGGGGGNTSGRIQGIKRGGDSILSIEREGTGQRVFINRNSDGTYYFNNLLVPAVYIVRVNPQSSYSIHWTACAGAVGSCHDHPNASGYGSEAKVYLGSGYIDLWFDYTYNGRAF